MRADVFSGMDLRPQIEKFSRRFAEVEAALSDPKAFGNPQRAQELGKEYARLKELKVQGEAYLKVGSDLADNRALLKSEAAESELAQMAREEIARLEAEEQRLALEIQRGILPPDPADSRNTIIEIRAGAGGQESALFAADLYRMYTRYAEARGWKVEDLDSSASDLGGYKEVIFQLNGTDVYKRLKYESGVHRVQRVPATEAQGRIHTSTCTVAVLPEAQDVDIELKPEDFGHHRLPRVRPWRARRQHDGLSGANRPQTKRADCPLRRPAVAAEEQSSSADGAALALARAQGGRGRGEIRRSTQGAGRHRRAQRTDPHLQLPAEPGDGPSDRANPI